MPEIWAKIEKFEKLIEKKHKFDLTYAFCSHFHSFCPIWLIFYMKYHHVQVHRVFPYSLSNLWTTTQNALKKYFWHLKVKVSCFNGFLSWLTLKQKHTLSRQFWKLVNKIPKKHMHIVIFYVKYQPKRRKSVEMRAKSILQVKFMDFFNEFFKFFNFCPFFRQANLKY